MTQNSKSVLNSKVETDGEDSVPLGVKHKQGEGMPSNLEGEIKQGSNHSRKSARSKREIMEELSRARFPWDE